MIVTFRSRAHADIIMFGDVAVQLLKLMGHSGAVPSALQPQDIPDALARLKQAVAEDKAAIAARPPAPPRDAKPEDEDEQEQEPPVQLAHRALPLIEMLEASLKEQCDVMWDK